MALGTDIRTYFNGTWHSGDVAVMAAADHGAWLGSSVFDGARCAHGVAPDLLAHCQRLNRSARALSLTPSVSAEKMVELVREGLALYEREAPIYIRPMYWGIDSGKGAITVSGDATGFAICMERVPLPEAESATTLTTTRFRRPVLESSVVHAKAGCLYPNNARMMAEAHAKGFGNALAADALGNVAETATTNVFIVRDGEVLTPVANGTFLAGITRARHMDLLARDGFEVREVVLSFDDVREADEVFLSGNMSKVTPVTAFDDRHYQIGPVTRRARELYWDWASGGD